MRFRPLSKTVVTDIRSFVVDSASKIGLYRQAVSAAVDLEKPLESKDLNVSLTDHYVLEDPSVILAISSPEPIKAVLIGSGPVVITPPVETPEIHHTAIVETVDSFEAGSIVDITVSDLDLEQAVASIGVVAYNEDTGETEHVECFRQTNGTYFGQLTTANNTIPGTNFDNVLNCSLGHTIQIIYSDPFTANNIRENITNHLTVLSPTETATIISRTSVSLGRPIPIEIRDKDSTGQTIPVVVTNISTGEQEILNATEMESGYYVISCATQTYNGTSYTQGDGALDVGIGHQVRIDYTDTNDLHGNTTVVSHIVDVVGTVTEVGSFEAPDEVETDSYLDITIRDYDLVGQQVGVTVSNTASSEYETVTLTETVFGSGVFKGQLAIATLTSGDNNDGVLLAVAGNRLRLVYVDIGGSLTTVEHFVDVVAPPNPEPDPDPDPQPDPDPDPQPDPDPNAGTGTVEFYVNGSFFLNGAFNGTIRLEGLNEEHTRCTLIVS